MYNQFLKISILLLKCKQNLVVFLLIYTLSGRTKKGNVSSIASLTPGHKSKRFLDFFFFSDQAFIISYIEILPTQEFSIIMIKMEI